MERNVANGLKFEVHLDTGSVKSRFDAVGSSEFKRGLQFALDETARPPRPVSWRASRPR